MRRRRTRSRSRCRSRGPDRSACVRPCRAWVGVAGVAAASPFGPRRVDVERRALVVRDHLPALATAVLAGDALRRALDQAHALAHGGARPVRLGHAFGAVQLPLGPITVRIRPGRRRLPGRCPGRRRRFGRLFVVTLSVASGCGQPERRGSDDGEEGDKHGGDEARRRALLASSAATSEHRSGDRRGQLTAGDGASTAGLRHRDPEAGECARLLQRVICRWNDPRSSAVTRWR
jgi:hypothetical protein